MNSKYESDGHDYIKDVADATGLTYKEAKENMDIARDQLGVPYKLYFEEGYYSFSRSRQERAIESWLRKKAREEKVLESISKETGFSIEHIIAEIDALNDSDETGLNIDPNTYSRYGMYELSREEAVMIINLLAELETKAKKLRSRFRKIDRGKLSYEDIEEEIDGYYELTRQTITPHLRMVLLKRFDNILSGLEADSNEAFKIIVDAEVSHSLLRFSLTEYKTFHLYKSSLQEKRNYVSNFDRKKIPSKINSKETFDLLSNKYFLYQKMPELFGRDIAAVYSKEDYDIFASYIAKHPEFVIKPFSSSIGRGISPVTVEDPSDSAKLRKLFRELLKENRTFLMEERILPNESMSSFNKDSINTIRMIAYYENETLKPVGTFLRTGRAGSFVDNGGAGGIFAAVDATTGTVITDGTDEEGNVYSEHPDSHVTYKGFQIPEWEQAIELVRKACQALADKCYVGWDLALTEDDRWIVVEGNGRSTYLHQGPLFHGVRDEIMELLK